MRENADQNNSEYEHFLRSDGLKWVIVSGKERETFLCPKCISLVSIPCFLSRCDSITHFLLSFFYTHSSLSNSHFYTQDSSEKQKLDFPSQLLIGLVVS